MASALNLTVARAISYLTRPLAHTYPASTVIKLQLALEVNLTALFAPTWLPSDPLHGSDRRMLSLSPDCLPPHAVYAACLSSGVQWFDWIALLGGRPFDLFVDPACVSVRFPNKGSRPGQLVTVWSSEFPPSSPPLCHLDDNGHHRHTLRPEFRSTTQSPTLAQQLLANDREEDEEIFAMLADEISAPSWIRPSRERFTPNSPHPPSSSVHSRSSSRSSNSSSNFSFVTSDCGSATTASTPSSSPNSKLELIHNKRSRRERSRQARVFVDPSKNQVTPYEGGKTTVLTGGVMLGAAPIPKVATRPAHVPVTYRVVRV